MENRVASRFVEQVNDLIPRTEDRDAIFQALELYQQNLDLTHLVGEMMKYIDEPNKLEIFEFLRPLIPPKHQMEYDKLAPPPAGQKLRVINLRRRPNESLGFAVRGGFEHGIGVFVSQVSTGSQADLQGLRVGDEIVRVNGFTIAEAIHEEVLNLIKNFDHIELKVTNIGMLPVRDQAEDNVTWKYVERLAWKKSQRDSGRKINNMKKEGEGEEVKVFINLRTAPSLGCSIISGPRNFPGIYVEVVKPNSLAEKVGMEAGDQILRVNDTSFIDITHKEAVVALKSSKELNVTLKKHVGIPLVQAGLSAASRQNQNPSSPPPLPLADDSSSAENDRTSENWFNVKAQIGNKSRQSSGDAEPHSNLPNRTEETVNTVSSYDLKNTRYNVSPESDDNDFVQIVEVLEPEVIIEDRVAPPTQEKDDTAERLEKLLQQKLEQNKKEAELLRMQDDILSGRGGPLKKSYFGLLGNPEDQDTVDNSDSTYF